MDIETRLETLEKKLRLHKRLGLAAACALVVAIAIGATKSISKVVTAEMFVLMDETGKKQGAWSMTPQGPLFMMTDGKRYRLFLSATNRTTGMAISDLKNKPRFTAGILKAKSRKEQFPGMVLFDKNGEIQVSVSAIDRKGTSSFSVLDSSGKQRASFGLTESQAPSFILEDAEGRIRSMYGLTKVGEPKLLFLDEKDEVYWVAPPESK